MEKEVKFDVIKEKIIKTDELIRLFKQKSDDLQRISLINKQHKTKLELRKNEIDKIKLENNALTTRVKTTDSKYKCLLDEHEHLKHKYNELEQEYFTKINDQQIKFQTVSQELVECREKLTQYEKLQDFDVSPTKRTTKTINNQHVNQLNGLKLQYSMLEQEFKELQKEHDLVVKALKKTEEQLQIVNSQTSKKENLKCDQKNCSFYKELANLQLDNYNLRKQINDLKYLEENSGDFAKLEQKYEDVQKELNNFKSKYDKKIEEISNLNSKLDQYKSENEELKVLKQKNSDKNSKIELLSTEIQLLKKQKVDLIKESNDTKEKITQLMNQIRENSATPNDELIHDIIKEMTIANIITPFEKELELENNQILMKEPIKLSTTSGDFMVSNINEDISTICDNSRNIIRRRKRKKIKNQSTNVDLLAALKVLTEANIKFTISNESALTESTNNNRNCYNFTIPKLEKQQLNNKTDFLTKKLDCNLECCNGFSSYYIMRNDDHLLGFLNIKNEINSKTFQDFIVNYQNDKSIITRDCSNNGNSMSVAIETKHSSENNSNKLATDTRNHIVCNLNKKINEKPQKNIVELRKSPRNVNRFKRHAEVPNCTKKDFDRPLKSTAINQQLANDRNITENNEEYSPIVKKKRIGHSSKEDINESNKIETSTKHHQETEVSVTIAANPIKFTEKVSNTSFKRPICNRRRSLRLSNIFDDEENDCRKHVNDSTQENIVFDENFMEIPKINDDDDDSSSQSPSPVHQDKEQQVNRIDQAVPLEEITENPNKIPEQSSNNVEIQHNEPKTSIQRSVCNRRRSLRLSNLFKDEENVCRKPENVPIQEIDGKSMEILKANNFNNNDNDAHSRKPHNTVNDNNKNIVSILDCIQTVLSDDKNTANLPQTNVEAIIEENPNKLLEQSCNNNVEIMSNIEKESKNCLKRSVRSQRRSLRLSNLFNDEENSFRKPKSDTIQENIVVEDRFMETPKTNDDDDYMRPQSPSPDDQDKEQQINRIDQEVPLEVISENLIKTPEQSSVNVDIQYNVQNEHKTSFKRPVCSLKQSNDSADDDDNISAQSPQPPIDQGKKKRIAHSRKEQQVNRIDQSVPSHEFSECPIQVPEQSTDNVDIQHNMQNEPKTSFKRPVCGLKKSNYSEDGDNISAQSSPPPTIDQGKKKRIAHSRKEQQVNRIDQSVEISECPIQVSEQSNNVEIQPEMENESETRIKRPVCSPRRLSNHSEDDDMNPQSPPSIDQGVINCDNLPKIIPLEKVQKMQLSKVKVLIEKLILYSSEEKALDEVVQQFTTQDPQYIAEIILERVIADRQSKADSKYTPPAPLLTENQRILLGFMVALDRNHVDIYENFLTLSEQYLFFNKNLDEILTITRLYLSVCKLRHDIHRIRKLCCEMFYFNYDYAVPFLFVILTSWTEVLPFEIDSKAFPLARILVQNVYISSCNQPGYNLLPLRDLLIKYYGYPTERWNSDELFDELFNIYRNNPIRSSDFNLLLLCKNHPEKWVYEKIHKHLIPLIDQISINNFKAAVIILIGNLSYNFSTNTEYLKNIREWMNSIITETTPDIVRRSVYLSLQRLMRKKMKNS